MTTKAQVLANLDSMARDCESAMRACGFDYRSHHRWQMRLERVNYVRELIEEGAPTHEIEEAVRAI